MKIKNSKFQEISRFQRIVKNQQNLIQNSVTKTFKFQANSKRFLKSEGTQETPNMHFRNMWKFSNFYQSLKTIWLRKQTLSKVTESGRSKVSIFVDLDQFEAFSVLTIFCDPGNCWKFRWNSRNFWSVWNLLKKLYFQRSSHDRTFVGLIWKFDGEKVHILLFLTWFAVNWTEINSCCFQQFSRFNQLRRISRNFANS